MHRKIQTSDSNDRVKQYSYYAVANIEYIFEDLQIKFHKIGNRIAFACPLHGSHNPNSGSIYLNNFTWSCYTRLCQEEHGKPVVFLIKALLEQNLEKTIDFKYLYGYIDSVCKNGTLETVVPEERKITRVISEGKIGRDAVRSRLQIPSPFFINRGFSPEILDRYDVGDCLNDSSPMKYRVVVPVYDDDYEKMVGCVGRTKNPACPKCGKYHVDYRKCPENPLELLWAAKWTVSKNFKVENYFYNLWFAKKHIQETKTAVLVEGQSDIWRLEEAGIKNGLGLFGARLTAPQSLILNELGVYNVIIATDNDATGSKVSSSIKKRLDSFYKVTILKPTAKDFGDMTIEQVQNSFKGLT